MGILFLLIVMVGLVVGEFEDLIRFMYDDPKEFYDNFELRNFPDSYERGLFAKEQFRASTVLFDVPPHKIFHEDILQNLYRDIVEKAVAKNKMVFQDSLFAIFYLTKIEADDELAEYWKPFLKSLPVDFSHMPEKFTEDELDLLEGTQLLYQLKQRLKVVREQYNLLVELVPDFWVFSFDQFLTCTLQFTTRIFNLDSELGIMTMVPLLDMTNHKFEANAYFYYDEETGHFQFLAYDDIDPGEEIYISYGPHSYSDQLFSYGYIDRDQVIFSIMSRLPLKKVDPLFSQKKAILKQVFGQWNFGFQDLRDDEISYPFLRWASMIEFDGSLEDFASFCIYISSESESHMLFFDMENQLRTLDRLQTYFESSLSTQPYTILEDYNLLKKGGLSMNARNCILVRMSEKVVMQRWLEFIEFARNYIETWQWSKLRAKALEDELVTQNHEYFSKIWNEQC